MTIKIEQEAILRVLNTPHLPNHPQHGDSRKLDPTDASVATPLSLPPCRVSNDVTTLQPTVDKFSEDFCPDLLSLDSDEEDCLSISSYGSASSFGGRSHERKVTFASPLVTEVRTRPRTPEADKGLLFYSEKETTRFRQEYRQERKTLTEDDNQCVQNECLGSPFDHPLSSEKSTRHRISRVVVEHNNSLETFYDFNSFAYSFQKEGDSSSSEVFFDNDSFWSGSITW
eukprot:CAMPEP_0171333506 /NCGR_PEP_ID=MMETSP0878-20121228/4052_1 /TAXON_ID=67004 /ORGANISM="Thalassiosira weissflogii, Strain CCMP1336" /LENGTH=227 /DNA_ID=CAMNT_0011834453 /DNA_START=71 /DNA_END=751 /DNA_ORIENTATION=+